MTEGNIQVNNSVLLGSSDANINTYLIRFDVCANYVCKVINCLLAIRYNSNLIPETMYKRRHGVISIKIIPNYSYTKKMENDLFFL